MVKYNLSYFKGGVLLNQFILGKNPRSINNIESRTQYEDQIFANERPDDQFIKEKLDIQQSTFANIGFRGAKIKESDLSHNVFINCYFKKTSIWNTNFTGSKFINCQFDGVNIQHSDFIYCSFENCYISYDDMFSNLPVEYNLRERLCRNLALECLKAGQDIDYKKYFFSEKKARELHDFETFRLNVKPYYKNKTGYQKITSLLNYINSKVSKILWGYGEDIYRLFIAMGLVILIYAFIYIIAGNSFKYQINDISTFKLNFIDAFYHSFSSFFTSSSGFYPSNTFIKMITISEYLVGATFIGCFVAAVYKNINRR